MSTPDYFDYLDRDQKQLLVFPDLLPLHKAIRLKRCFDGLSQSDLAALIGMGAGTLCEIERGARTIPKKHKERLNSYLYNEFYVDGKLQEGYYD